MTRKQYFTLTKHDRERIEKWIDESHTYVEMVRRIGCSNSTVSREIVRGTDSQSVYRAVYAEKKATARIRSRKLGKRKILMRKGLQDYVHAGLQQKWSPKQIAETLKETYIDTAMHTSPEAIYQYIYVLPRGSLKKTLVEGLRRSHKYRHTQRQKE